MNSELLKSIRLHKFMHIWDKRIEPERESGILSRHHKLGEQVGDHFFRDAENHLHIPQADATPNQVVSDLQVPYISQPCGICSYMQTGLRVSVETIRSRASEAKETDHVFRVQQLFARDAGSDELRRARRIHYDCLFQRAPKYRHTV